MGKFGQTKWLTGKVAQTKGLQRIVYKEQNGARPVRAGRSSGITQGGEGCQGKSEGEKNFSNQKNSRNGKKAVASRRLKQEAAADLHGSTRIGIGRKPFAPRRTQGARRGSGQRQPRMARMNTGPLGFCFARFGLRPARRPSAERNGGIIHLPTVETVGFDISALPGLRKENPHTSKCGLCGAPGNK